MKASAQILVTINVPIADTWPDGTDVATIRQQAVASAVTRLREILRGPAGPHIVGEPRVTIVLVEDV